VYSYEGPVDQVRPVKFGGDRREALKKHLQSEHEAVFQVRASMKQKWEDWIKQANSRLPAEGAGARDAKIDMTLTRERMFQSAARLQTPLFQQDQLMAARPRTSGPESNNLAINTEDLFDYITDRADMMTVSDDWIEQFQIFPYGVVKTPFVTKITNIKSWQSITIDEYEASKSGVTRRVMKDGSVKYFREVDGQRIVKSGAFPFVIPAEDFLFSDACDIDSAEWVTHRIYLTKQQLSYRIKEGIYDKKTPDGEDVLDVIGAPSSDNKPLLGIHDEVKESAAEAGKKYEILETYLCFDVDGKGTDYEIIVSWERNSGVFLRAVHNFYHEYQRPFVIHQYKHVNGSLYGIPMTFFLEPLHRAYSASIRQRLDAASKANEVAVFVPPGHPVEKMFEGQSIRGGVYSSGGFGKDEIYEFSVSQPFTQLPQLEQVLEQRADRIAHLAPESYGEQTQDRPTAQGTMQVLEEGKQPQYSQFERFIRDFALVVKHMIARYRQFYPEGLTYYIQQETPEGINLVEQFFSWPPGSIEDDVVIETKASSSTMSKSVRKQEVVALLDKMPQIYETMMGMAQAASEPSPTSMIAAKVLGGYQKTVDKFMREFDIGEKEALNPDLVQEAQVAQNLAQFVQQLQQQLQQMQGQLQQLQAESAQKDQILNDVFAGSQGPEMAGPPTAAPPMA
jgi:hypothetical protein